VGGQPHAPATSTPEKDPVPIVQETGWAAGPVWTGGKSRPHRDSIPDRPQLVASSYTNWATRPTCCKYYRVLNHNSPTEKYACEFTADKFTFLFTTAYYYTICLNIQIMQPAGLLALIWDKRLEKRDRVMKVHRCVASSLHCSLPLTAHAITWAPYAPPHTLIFSIIATPSLFHWIALSRPQKSYTPPSIDCDVTHWHLLYHPFTPLIPRKQNHPLLERVGFRAVYKIKRRLAWMEIAVELWLASCKSSRTPLHPHKLQGMKKFIFVTCCLVSV